MSDKSFHIALIVWAVITLSLLGYIAYKILIV